jgi:hypothetical protein
MPDARALIQQLQSAHAGANVDDVSTFERLTEPIVQLTEALREGYQASIQDQVLAMIDKLRAQALLSPDDLAKIESFIVGDAEAYTRLENNFQDWVAELGRVVGVLGGMSGSLGSGRGWLDALGEVEDAHRVLNDICNYLQQKERVTRFRRTVAQGLTPERAQMLIEILKELRAPLVRI